MFATATVALALFLLLGLSPFGCSQAPKKTNAKDVNRFTIMLLAEDGRELGRTKFGEEARNGRIVSIDSVSGQELSLPVNWPLNHLERQGDAEKKAKVIK